MSYTPHTFSDGSVLYASSLNEMDAEIVGLGSYDMVVSVTQTSWDDPLVGTVVSGLVDTIASKMHADPGYVPRVLVKFDVWYGSATMTRRIVVEPWLLENTIEKQLCFVTSGFFSFTSRFQFGIRQNGSVYIDA